MSLNSAQSTDSFTIADLDGDVLAYGEQSGAVLIDQGENASLLPEDIEEWTDVTLTVSVVDMPLSQVLSVRNRGMEFGQITVIDGLIEYHGAERIIIGEIEGGNGNALTIRLETTDPVVLQALLRNLTFEDTSDTPREVNALSIVFSDNTGTLATAEVAVNIEPLNDEPVGGADTYALEAGEAISGNVTDNDFDPDDDPGQPSEEPLFHVVSVDGRDGATQTVPEEGTIAIVGQYGTLVIDRNGVFTYTADRAAAVPPGVTVLETFVYRIDDGIGEVGGGAEVEITFAVTGPVLLDVSGLDTDELTYAEDDQPVLIDAGSDASVVSKLSSLNGIVLTIAVEGAMGSENFSVINQGSGAGQIGVSASGAVTFGELEIGVLTGGLGEPLSVVFNENATDAAIAALLRRIAYADTSQSPADKDVTVSFTNGSVLLSVSHLAVVAEPIDDEPIAGGDTVTVTAGGSVTQSVLSNDTDPDDSNAVLTVTGFYAGTEDPETQALPGDSIQGAYGTLVLNENGTYTYFANNTAAIPEGEWGYDVFTYSIESSAGGEASGQITIKVDRPLAETLFTFMNFDGDALIYTEQSGPTLFDQDATVISDDVGWAGVKLIITLTGATPGEILDLLSQGTGNGEIGVSGLEVSYSGNTIGTLAQSSGQSLELTLNQAASDAAVSAILCSIRYANPHEVLAAGSRTITVKASIGGQVYGIKTATFQLAPVDDPIFPVGDAFIVMEDAAVSGNVFANDVDPDRPPPLMPEFSIHGATAGSGTPVSQDISESLVVAGLYGTLVLNRNGTFNYRADRADQLIAGESVQDVFTYLVRNDTGDEATASLVFTVNGADEVRAGTASADNLTGGRGADQISGLGGNDVLQGFEGTDTLTGDAGNDTLDGGAGADIMHGGAGNDTYVIDNGRDKVLETGKGTDRILTTVNITLQKKLSLEILVGQSSATQKLKLVGNELSQQIFGGLGADTINGKGGADTLKGDRGKDVFIFDSRSGGVDTILDFKVKEDRIHLAGKAFGLSKGKLKADAFVKFKGSPIALESGDRILYDRSKGHLYIDLDGSDDRAPVLFATLKNKPNLGAKDFFIF